MSNTTFLHDLKLGQEAERNVAEFLVRNSMHCALMQWGDDHDRKYYDLIAQLLPEGRDFTLEVKRDIKHAETGNIAIEVANVRQGGASGIFITGADIWVHVLGSEFYATKRETLFEYIHCVDPYRTVNNAGDGNAKIYLYKSKEILPAIFHRIDNLEQKDLYLLFRKFLNAELTS